MERVSVAADGTQGDDYSATVAVNEDGSYVAYYSESSNLVPGDTNGTGDVFLRERSTGATTLVSKASDGTQGDEASLRPTMSSDANYIAYSSEASNLVPGDTNDVADVFLFDRSTGTTTRVSKATNGAQSDGFSDDPVISADGNYVTYYSIASNLVPGDTNGTGDVFLFDRAAGTTTRVSKATNGAQGDGDSQLQAMSSDGSLIVYMSDSTNLVAGDTNGRLDVFLFDRAAGTTTRVSVASDGTQADHNSSDPTISADGNFIAYSSEASNLVPGDTNGVGDVFLFDRSSATTTRVSVASDGTQADGSSITASISVDGNFVTYGSYASNLVPGDTGGSDVFVFDRAAGTTTRVSVAGDGTQADDDSSDPAISADGAYVAYESQASNLVPGDTNATQDVFVFHRTG